MTQTVVSEHTANGNTDSKGALVPGNQGNNSAVADAAQQYPDLATLITRYFRHIPAEDLPTKVSDVLAIITAHQRLALQRPQNTPKIRVYNPQAADDEWSTAATVVNIVNDDMPYLVDSVISALTAAGAVVFRVLHPILDVRRDPQGNLIEVLGAAAKGAGTGGFRGRDVYRESWVHLLIDRITDAERAENIELQVTDVLAQVRDVVEDTDEMSNTAKDLAAMLRRTPPQLPAQEIIEGADLLDWLADGHLTFLGYQQFETSPGSMAREEEPVPPTAAQAEESSGPEQLLPIQSSGLGLFRDNVDPDGFTAEIVTKQATAKRLLVLTRASAPTKLAKNLQPFYVGVREFDDNGVMVGEHRFVGLLTPRALNSEVNATPVLRRTVDEVLLALGASVDSYTGQRAVDLLATYPRAELFWAETSSVVDLVRGVLQITSRRALRIFLQPDPYGRFISALVFLPRDRYTTAGRLAMMQVLLEELGGSDIRYTARVGDSQLAAVHFTVTTDPHHSAEIDLARLNDKVRETIRTWEDELVTAIGGDNVLDTAGERSRYVEAFDEAYKGDYAPASAVEDLQRLDALRGPEDFGLSILDAKPGRPGNRRLKMYVTGATVTLSRALPLLQSMGAEVIDENPYQVKRSDGTPSRIYDFGLNFPTQYLAEGDNVSEVRSRFTDAFTASWSGLAEVDGFNTLVLAAGLDWRQVATVRAYAHYLRQIGTPYTQGYIETVLTANPALVTKLAHLFAARFEPSAFGADAHDQREAECTRLAEEITSDLDQVSSLDADRILRSYLRLILATDRTNVYRTDDNDHLREFMSFKLNPRKIPNLPKPVPAHEIWVYSPRLEGVHLRFGDVARGGLRWSDRPEDFRTEILGLVKAQEVKNAVIVPVGAKGGFVVKQPPAPTGDAAADRDAFGNEGIACYKQFIQGLLDLTDNRSGGEVVAPQQVVRHDGDDPYLVVAADKGTAKFSDTANGVAADNGFWLDDAFASGGSAGYDHKGMGITARGAWESVKHHFRELGIDTQTQDFTVVGVGDMSGDVFGNGMLLSEHIRLIAAFDHRHIFIDPRPDAAISFQERRRIFDLPRSSWADYNPELISSGGGIFERSLKSIPLTDQIREALGLEADVLSLSPNELMHAILLAPVDLLWNGGVGTYVKSVTESDVQVGDKANDNVRVNGGELRVKVVGEGGNLGVTQLGRIEFARAGGRINTDAIDNSAGVDTSDHEVNIKIALQPLLASGELTLAGRDELLASMTDEVAELVLADNIAQNRVLGTTRHHAGPMLTVHARLIDELVQQGRLDRALEFLPTQAQINQRVAAGEGLSSPELSVLVAYVKAALSKEMIKSELPDMPAFAHRLPDYFPVQMREGYAEAIQAHPLRREIVTTMMANDVVNGAGISFAFRLTEEMAATPTDSIRAYLITTRVFGLPELWDDIAAVNNQVPASVQDRLFLDSRRLLDRAARWFLSWRPQPLNVTGEIERYQAIVHALTPKMPRLLVGVEHESIRRDVAVLTDLGAPADLAHRVAYSLYTFSLLDVVDVSMNSGREPLEVAELYYAMSAHLGLDGILSAVTNLDRGDRWHALARQAIRDGVYSSVRAITADVLTTTTADQSAADKIAQWEQENRFRLERARITLGQIAGTGAHDLAALSVAAREINSLIR